MGVIALKSLIHRRWLNENEKRNSRYQKSWCKPIDIKNAKLAIAALKYAFKTGADIMIPPGDFRHFSFAVDHIEEVVDKSLSKEEKKLLDNEFQLVKDYPFFDPRT